MRSTARVITERPHRYAKQLASHLGRRCRTSWDADSGTGSVDFPGGAGTGSLVAEPGVLLLAVDADAGALDRLEDVLGRHLVRFGTKDELTVEWRREDGAPGTVQRGGDDSGGSGDSDRRSPV